MEISPHNWLNMTQHSPVRCFSLHATFNTALPPHMEASSELVIAGYVEVGGLIRTMCRERRVYICHVSPRGNQLLQRPTRVLSQTARAYS